MKRKPEEIKALLEQAVLRIKDPSLKDACYTVLRDERFWNAPAAAKKHQAYSGGLAEHVLENIEIALATMSAPPLKDVVNEEVVIAGLLWHDYGKIWDYALNPGGPQHSEPSYVYTRHRWTIRHLSRSFAEFCIAARNSQVSEDLIEQVGHTILAHHGHGSDSPVEALTIEAAIVHQSDMISAVYIEKARSSHLFKTKRPVNQWKNI